MRLSSIARRTRRRSRSPHCSIRLVRRGFRLLDAQWVTPHLEQFVAIEISRREYLSRLKQAVALECDF